MSIDEFSFLSRKFRLENGIVYAPLNMDSIIGMLAWIKDPKKRCSRVHQLSLNVEIARWELVEHGRDVFDYWNPFLVSMRSLVRLDCPWPSYEEMLSQKLSERQ